MFLAVIIYLVQALVMGCISMYISDLKGYNGGFAWGFWLGILGVLVVGFRPTLREQSYGEQDRPLRSANDGAMWECICGAANSGTLDYCTSCRRSRSEAEHGKMRCPHCGAVNSELSETCFACNRPLREDAASRMALPSGTNAGASGMAGAEAAASASDGGRREVIEMIEMLAKLHSEGLLTDDEFREKKAELLSRI